MIHLTRVIISCDRPRDAITSVTTDGTLLLMSRRTPLTPSALDSPISCPSSKVAHPVVVLAMFVLAMAFLVGVVLLVMTFPNQYTLQKIQ